MAKIFWTSAERKQVAREYLRVKNDFDKTCESVSKAQQVLPVERRRNLTSPTGNDMSFSILNTIKNEIADVSKEIPPIHLNVETAIKLHEEKTEAPVVKIASVEPNKEIADALKVLLKFADPFIDALADRVAIKLIQKTDLIQEEIAPQPRPAQAASGPSDLSSQVQDDEDEEDDTDEDDEQDAQDDNDEGDVQDEKDNEDEEEDEVVAPLAPAAPLKSGVSPFVNKFLNKVNKQHYLKEEDRDTKVAEEVKPSSVALSKPEIAPYVPQPVKEAELPEKVVRDPNRPSILVLGLVPAQRPFIAAPFSDRANFRIEEGYKPDLLSVMRSSDLVIVNVLNSSKNTVDIVRRHAKLMVTSDSMAKLKEIISEFLTAIGK